VCSRMSSCRCRCRELRSFFSQLAQEPLSALVDKRDFIEVNDTSAAHMGAMVLPPTCPEFITQGSVASHAESIFLRQVFH